VQEGGDRSFKVKIGGQGLTLDILAQISHAPLERLEQDASVED
jgi:hypothetical protein